MVIEQEGGHLANEGQQLGAEVVPEGTEFPYVGGVIRWPLTNDLPYAYIEYPQDVDLSYAMQRASNVIAAMRKVRDANTLPNATPHSLPQMQNPPQTPPQAAQQPQAPQMAPPQGNALGQPIQAAEQLFCPAHREVVRPSKYPKYDVLDSGEQVQSNYWHPIAPYIDAQTNKEIKSHSLWRRELVHADGSPVEGGQMGGA